MGAVETTGGGRPLTSPETGEPNAAFNITPFMRLARTHAASTASDAVVATALAGTIFFAAATADARGKVFLYLLLTMAPFAVVAPLIGPALDRAKSGRRWVVVGTSVARGVLCFALIGRADTLLLYPVAFGILVLQKAYGIARSSLVPAVVESDEELVEANSKLQLLSGIMGFVGAAPGALLFKIFNDNPAGPLALAVCGFAITAGLALRIPKVAVAPTSATPQEKAELRSVGVLLAAAGMGLLRGIVGFLTLYFAFHFRETEELVAFGFIAAASVGGTLLGSVLAPRLRQSWPEERMLIGVLVMTVGAGTVATVVGGTFGAGLLGAAVGIGSTAGKLAFDSIVQRDAPDANRGRLFAKFETRFQLIWVVGSMLGLLPLGELRLSFLGVALVSGFAAFSYIVGLSAWRHRTGETDSEFGRQAVLIDQAMTQAQAKAKTRVRDSTMSLITRVRTRGDGKQEVVVTAGPVGGPAGGPAVRGSLGGPAVRRAGPGIGTAMTPAAGTPAVTGRRPRLRKDPRPGPSARPAAPASAGPADPTRVARDPGDRPDDPTEVAPRRDPTTFAPAPPPPANR
jgi:hypothetical protein